MWSQMNNETESTGEKRPERAKEGREKQEDREQKQEKQIDGEENARDVSPLPFISPSVTLII